VNGAPKSVDHREIPTDVITNPSAINDAFGVQEAWKHGPAAVGTAEPLAFANFRQSDVRIISEDALNFSPRNSQ
jgi:hypothetical protein